MQALSQLSYIWVSVEDVLLLEGPIPFGNQNASHLHMLSLAGYLQSPRHSSESADPYTRLFMGSALDCGLGLIPFLQNILLAIIPFTLPGALSHSTIERGTHSSVA